MIPIWHIVGNHSCDGPAFFLDPKKLRAKKIITGDDMIDLYTEQKVPKGTQLHCMSCGRSVKTSELSQVSRIKYK